MHERLPHMVPLQRCLSCSSSADSGSGYLSLSGTPAALCIQGIEMIQGGQLLLLASQIVQLRL